jgi:hypothetical protein
MKTYTEDNRLLITGLIPLYPQEKMAYLVFFSADLFY